VRIAEGTGRETREGENAPSVTPTVTVREKPQLQDTGVMPAAKRPAPAPEGPSTPQPAPSTPKAAPAPGAWRKGAPPIPGPGLSVEPPVTFPELASMAAVAEVIKGCRKCALCEGRTNTVPGEGPLDAKFVVVGEGPGATEDELGRPFVGRAGELLDSILGGIDIPRSSAYILNIVKCRPPSNRTPLPDEAAACLPYLHRQLAILRPKVILAAGSTAIAHLLQSKQALGKLRGQVHRYAGIPVIATYHPAALLRNPNWKRPTWDDVRIARQLFDA
ncbi:MAG TPA: uracil-DNA glycosylase, partial [Gemmatimonadales bacterium]|nr:uracil-DNA glycosylase [Gemmatimonadales bacterium]